MFKKAVFVLAGLVFFVSCGKKIKPDPPQDPPIPEVEILSPVDLTEPQTASSVKTEEAFSDPADTVHANKPPVEEKHSYDTSMTIPFADLAQVSPDVATHPSTLEELSETAPYVASYLSPFLAVSGLKNSIFSTNHYKNFYSYDDGDFLFLYNKELGFSSFSFISSFNEKAMSRPLDPPPEEPVYLIYWQWPIFDGQDKASFIEISNDQGDQYKFLSGDIFNFLEKMTKKYGFHSLTICLKIKESKFTGLSIKTSHKISLPTWWSCPNLLCHEEGRRKTGEKSCFDLGCPEPSEPFSDFEVVNHTICNDCPKARYFIYGENQEKPERYTATHPFRQWWQGKYYDISIFPVGRYRHPAKENRIFYHHIWAKTTTAQHRIHDPDKRDEGVTILYEPLLGNVKCKKDTYPIDIF